jgi:UDP-N-acetylmuramyl pentapeptide synthase
MGGFEMKQKEYALYKGEKILSIGTIKEIAKELNVLPETIHFYQTPTYMKRLKNRKTKNARVLICLDNNLDDDSK